MNQPPKTEAQTILAHFEGNEFDAAHRTISDIAATSGGERTFNRENGKATMIWTFSDSSTIHVDVDKWTAKEGPNAKN